MNAADRFTKRNLVLNYNTLEALQDYFENGGTITVCKAGRRSKANTSFSSNRGSVAYRGAKVETLRKNGLSKANKGK